MTRQGNRYYEAALRQRRANRILRWILGLGAAVIIIAAPFVAKAGDGASVVVGDDVGCVSAKRVTHRC